MENLIERHIPDIGNVRFKPYITFGMVADAEEIVEKAEESQKANAYTNCILASLFEDPRITPEGVARLSPNTLQAVIETAIEIIDLKNEFDATSDNLPIRVRFYEANMAQEREIAQKFAESMGGIVNSLKIEEAFVPYTQALADEIKQISATALRNVVGNGVLNSGRESFYLQNGQVSSHGFPSEKTTHESIIPSDEAFKRIKTGVRINIKSIEKNIIQARRESVQFFKLTLVAVGIGFILIGIGVVLLYFQKTTGGIVSSIAGLITQFISRLFFTKDKELRASVEAYHKLMLESQKILTMTDIAETINDATERDRIKQEIIRKSLNIDNT